MASTSTQQVDNSEASISQQINVVGTAHFAPPPTPTPITAAAPVKPRSPTLRLFGMTTLMALGLTLYLVDPIPYQQWSDSLQGGMQKGNEPRRSRALSSPGTPPAITAILDGVNPAIVRACATKEAGLKPGTAVPVLLVINGETGKMTAFTALGDFAGTSLAKCIEAEVEKAEFPLFDGPRQKVPHTFTL